MGALKPNLTDEEKIVAKKVLMDMHDRWMRIAGERKGGGDITMHVAARSIAEAARLEVDRVC